jgi:NADPH-dependent 2,4-dienoyl-CoA reductase/sulfur reductase-like enzyme/ferredoxin
VSAEVGTSLLEVAERAGLPLEAGCRMGVCGADPVAVLDGASCLSAPEEEELDTLRRLGFAKNTRMACSARLESGPVTVSLTPEPGTPDGGALPREFDRSIVSVVVLGNGIAGVTAADFVRRGHPECEIHVVGEEPHVLYNRMGISRLVYGRSAMQGLFLLPEQWYDEHQVTAWLNTVATGIDLASQRVFLGTGEVLPYDRLILATGSRGVEPPVAGFGRPAASCCGRRRTPSTSGPTPSSRRAGTPWCPAAACWGWRPRTPCSSSDCGSRCSSAVRGCCPARSTRAAANWSTRTCRPSGCRSSTAPRRSRWPARTGSPGVTLGDRRSLRCDLFLAAVGIRPNVDLAQRAGIPVGRGVLVDDRMWTGVPGVYAAGDVAEHGGRVLGLWPIAAKQGEVAAVNALGGNAVLTAEVPATILKGVGLDLFSIGRVQPEPEDEVVVVEDASLPSYRRLVVAQHRAVGGIVLGHHPEDVVAVTSVVKKQVELDDAVLADLRSGHWQVLKDVGRRGAVSQPARA